MNKIDKDSIPAWVKLAKVNSEYHKETKEKNDYISKLENYYDILKKRSGALPLLIADVEGKGLSAALLAASSQAVFHSLNELYFFEPSKFVAKANSLIYDFTRGNRFITLCWLLLEDNKRQVTYVNAGHVAPFFISKKGVKTLSMGGFLTGFVPDAAYQKETLKLQRGDLIIAFTDGVPEAENPQGEELGEEAMIKYFQNPIHFCNLQGEHPPLSPSQRGTLLRLTAMRRIGTMTIQQISQFISYPK